MGQLRVGETVKGKFFWLAQRLKIGNEDAHDEVQRANENVENVRGWICSSRGLALRTLTHTEGEFEHEGFCKDCATRSEW